MKERFRQFMQGRYGMDQLSQFLNIVTIVLLLLGIFGVPLATMLALAGLIFTYYRMFSKNVDARTKENLWYMQKKSQVTRWFTTRKQRFSQRDTYRYFRCPQCHQDLRVPKGKGEVTITCPKCHTQFTKKS